MTAGHMTRGGGAYILQCSLLLDHLVNGFREQHPGNTGHSYDHQKYLEEFLQKERNKIVYSVY